MALIRLVMYGVHKTILSTFISNVSLTQRLSNQSVSAQSGWFSLIVLKIDELAAINTFSVSHTAVLNDSSGFANWSDTALVSIYRSVRFVLVVLTRHAITDCDRLSPSVVGAPVRRNDTVSDALPPEA